MTVPKVTFLFGAGAEAPFDLPLGDDFQKIVIPPRAGKNNVLVEALRKMYKQQTAQTNKYKEWLASAYRADIVYEEDLKNSDDENFHTFGHMEKYFHTIISPQAYGRNNFWKVVNHYWFAFFSVADALNKKLKAANYSGRHFELNRDLDVGSAAYYGYILSNLQNYLKEIYTLDWREIFESKPSYYDAQYYKSDANYQVQGIITTNYTPLVKITGLDYDQIAYINGEMRCFEYPYELIVEDVVQEGAGEMDGFFFPFLFTQSAVKPIVAPYQIKEMSKAIGLLEESNILAIIGYGINEDDNHINAVIVDFVRRSEKNSLLKFSIPKKGRSAAEEKQELYKKLRLEGIEKNVEVIMHADRDIETIHKSILAYAKEKAF